METIAHVSTATQANLFLCQILPGRNPRTFFDKEEMELLTASIFLKGVLQPILVRPSKTTEGSFQLVAGERRFRAALSAFGEEYQIPVMIKEMTDAEADAAAVIENTVRSDMSATEEAAAAAKEVGRAKGDREEAARVLSWPLAKLNKRLALMNCSNSVRTALNERVISLGHAELLASLTKDTQDKFLPVIVNEKKTVAELKGTIEQAATKLSVAIFDKEECNGCPHNSTLQSSMFEESIADGSCTNPTCYKEKTESTLNNIASGLKDDYPVIRIIRIGENSTLVKVAIEGDKGVGLAQAEACRACSDFGAAVSALPQSMGVVYKNQCFNPVCNANKIAARIVADKKAATPVAVKSTEKNVAANSVSPQKNSVDKSDIAKANAKTTSVSEGERIKEYRVKVWRNAMKKEIASSPEKSRQYLIAICLSGSARNIDSSALSKAFSTLAGNQPSPLGLGQNAKYVEESSPAILEKMMTLLAASAMEQIEVNQLQQLAKHHQLDLTKYWALDSTFLDLMTKSEIEFLATEIGLDKAYGDKFKKLFSEKKPDLIKKLLSIDGVDYSAVIPAVLAY